MAAPLFEAQHLSKRYGDTTVVNDLSFAIAPGECLGVIGPNGAGKTTTIRMCLGQTVPDAGSINAMGLQMPQDALAIKAQLGVVSQFDTLDPDFTCAENLLVYGRYFGMKDAAIRERIPQLLAFAALSHKADATPGELSGGMRRRVAAARTLIYSPDLILYDEPTTGLDPATCENFCKVMNDIKKHKGVASIMVTHNMEDALAVGDRFLLLRHGVPEWQGPLAELKKMPEDFLMKFFRGEDL